MNQCDASSSALYWTKRGCASRSLCVPSKSSNVTNLGFCACDHSYQMLRNRLNTNSCEPSPYTFLYGAFWLFCALFVGILGFLLGRLALHARATHALKRDVLCVSTILCVLSCGLVSVHFFVTALQSLVFDSNQPQLDNDIGTAMEETFAIFAGFALAVLNTTILVFGSSMAYVLHQSSRLVGIRQRHSSNQRLLLGVVTLSASSIFVIVPIWLGDALVSILVTAVYSVLVLAMFQKLNQLLLATLTQLTPFRQESKHSQVIQTLRGAVPPIMYCFVAFTLALVATCIVWYLGRIFTNKTLLGPVCAILLASQGITVSLLLQFTASHLYNRLAARIYSRRTSAELFASPTPDQMRELRLVNVDTTNDHHDHDVEGHPICRAVSDPDPPDQSYLRLGTTSFDTTASTSPVSAARTLAPHLSPLPIPQPPPAPPPSSPLPPLPPPPPPPPDGSPPPSPTSSLDIPPPPPPGHPTDIPRSIAPSLKTMSEPAIPWNNHNPSHNRNQNHNHNHNHHTHRRHHHHHQHHNHHSATESDNSSFGTASEGDVSTDIAITDHDA